MVAMFHDVDDLIFSAEEDKKYHSTKWYFLITVMRPVFGHRRFQALKTQRTVIQPFLKQYFHPQMK